MNVGYYYHVEAAFQSSGQVRVPSHFGLFLHEMAEQAGQATAYLHEGSLTEAHDMVLDEALVKVVNLGPRRRAPAMTFLPGPSLRNFRPGEHGVDVVVIRGPTALLPSLRRAARELPVVLQLVGDLANWKSQTFFSWWRNALISLWVKRYQRQQDLAARGALVLVKSEALTRRDGRPYENSAVCFTSTLTQASLGAADRRPWGPGKGSTEPVRLLHTGRIVKDKGLFEALRAVAQLEKQGIATELHLVGWSDPRDPTAAQLVEVAEDLGVANRVVFAGYRSAGDELMAEYLEADVYVSPTYGEGGVSKSIIEAMATGMPVVTTRTPAVRGALVDGLNALLVEPGSTSELVQAIERVVRDESLRTSISAAAREWAEGLTLERSVEAILGQLRDWVDKCAASTSRPS